MKLIIFLNILLALSTFFVSNDFFSSDGYLIYLSQFILNVFILISFYKIRLSHIFLPSLFSYLFISVNLILGGYLVPRGFGFYSDYSTEVLIIKNYNLFTPYILLSLTIFYSLSIDYIRKSNHINKNTHYFNKRINYTVFLLYVVSLFIGFPVAVQLGFLIVFLNELDRKKIVLKYIFYIVILSLSLSFYSFDKRNIIVVLFLILFFEALDYKEYLKLNLKNLIKLSVISILFLFLIISASIRRGYGDFDNISLISTIGNSVKYVKSDLFVDAITDNLELNYNYGATFVAMNYVEEGLIDYQYGLTLIKPLFFFIPREIYPDKPYSFMHLYTRKYEYGKWLSGSSLPVIFPVELYGNFHYLGLVVLYFFYKVLNKMFLYAFNRRRMSIYLFTCLFFVVTHLFFIRGGGIDLYVLYFLFAIPVYYLSRILQAVKL